MGFLISAATTSCFYIRLYVSYHVTDDHPDLAALVPVAAAHHRSDGVVHHGNRSDLKVLDRRGK